MNEGLLRYSGSDRPETCNGAAAMISIRSTRRLHRRSPRRGVSLVELLVVLAIMLLIFAMAGVLLGPPLRKARLAAAANDLAVLAQKLPIEGRARRGGQGLFVYLKGTPGTRRFELIADTGERSPGETSSSGTPPAERTPIPSSRTSSPSSFQRESSSTTCRRPTPPTGATGE